MTARTPETVMSICLLALRPAVADHHLQKISAHQKTRRRRAFVPLTSRISHLFQVPLRVTARCGFGLDTDESFPPRPA
ncbi:hypothetical protein BDZ89DRAFT_1080910, partial [Hymenopellis radicata]